eukprot:9209357-Pyramimonas_sp.AAC.1
MGPREIPTNQSDRDAYLHEGLGGYQPTNRIGMLTYTRASGDTNRLIGQQDESVRLWNIRTGVMVLIFAGARGHRNEVLSVDFHPTERW